MAGRKTERGERGRHAQKDRERLVCKKQYTVFELPTRSRLRAQAKNVSGDSETGSPRHVPNELLQMWKALCWDRLRFTCPRVPRSNPNPFPDQGPQGQASRPLVLAPPGPDASLLRSSAPLIIGLAAPGCLLESLAVRRGQLRCPAGAASSLGRLSGSRGGLSFANAGIPCLRRFLLF